MVWIPHCVLLKSGALSTPGHQQIYHVPWDLQFRGWHLSCFQKHISPGVHADIMMTSDQYGKLHCWHKNLQNRKSYTENYDSISILKLHQNIYCNPFLTITHENNLILLLFIFIKYCTSKQSSPYHEVYGNVLYLVIIMKHMELSFG